MKDENTTKILKWLEEDSHLPAEIKDFHDQKELFRLISETFKDETVGESTPPLGTIDSHNAHVYVIDKFLKFMAIHGYTLQKARKKGVVFDDLGSSLSEFSQRRREREGKVLQKLINK
jgi:hypothetical protein